MRHNRITESYLSLFQQTIQPQAYEPERRSTVLKNPLIAGLLFFVLSSVCVLGLTAAWQIFDLPPVVINLPATRVPSSLRVTPTSKGVQIQTPTATSATPRQMTRTPTLASLPKEYLVQPGTLLWTTISDISAAPETGTALLPGTKGQKVNVDGEIQVNSRVYWHICEQKEKNPWCGYMIAPGLKPRPAVTKTSVLPTFAPTVAPSLTLSPDDEFIFGASSNEELATPSPTVTFGVPVSSGVDSTSGKSSNSITGLLILGGLGITPLLLVVLFIVVFWIYNHFFRPGDVRTSSVDIDGMANAQLKLGKMTWWQAKMGKVLQYWQPYQIRFGGRLFQLVNPHDVRGYNQGHSGGVVKLVIIAVIIAVLAIASQGGGR